jgi:flagellar hook-associated protein 3 FlgL
MRITNQMMVNSSISNIQGNKSQLNDLSTQLSTQKKINKPSDDPIIAIRALRLRSSLDEVTQYLGKNIPDASSWLSVTHDALDESNKIIQDLYNYCVQGSTDSYSESERNTLAESLNKLVEAYYEQGNVDYAGRYVFTGHATDKPLTYQSDETAKDVDYTITQNFTREDLSNKTAYTNAYTNDDIINLNVKTDANGNIITPNITDVHRIQLAYDEINGRTFSMSMGDNNSANITIADDGSVAIDGGLTVPVTDADGNTADTAVNVVTTTDPNYVPGENEIAINSTTGELLLGENVYKSVC